MASNNSTTSFDDLPQETASNIFLSLPVKALIRSTSVNKKWYSLITNPHFISSQIKHAISHSHHNAVLIVPPFTTQEKHCSLVSAETSKLIEKFEIPFTIRSNTLKLVASVNGLLLFTDLKMFFSSRDLYLWNPCLKTHKTLVSTCFKKLLGNPYGSYYFVGFGFSEACDDYRVVRIIYVEDSMGNLFGEVAPKVEVYSLKKQTWKKMIDPRVPRLASNFGVYVGGCFYWLEQKKLDIRPYDSKNLWMLSFDFDSEVFREVKFPEKVSDCLGADARFKLMVFDGLLALCVFSIHNNNGVISHPHRVWLMRQNNGVISWTLRFKATLKKGGWPISITKAGTILIETYPLVGRIDVTRILSCNLKSLHYKDLGVSKPGGEEALQLGLEPSTLDSSFTESMVMYKEGKSVLKFTK